MHHLYLKNPCQQKHVDLWAHMMHMTTPSRNHLMCPQVSAQNIYWSLTPVQHQPLGTPSLDILQTVRLQRVVRVIRKRGVVYGNNIPVILSSSFIEHFSPLDTTFSRPIQFGSAKFQSAALEV